MRLSYLILGFAAAFGVTVFLAPFGPAFPVAGSALGSVLTPTTCVLAIAIMYAAPQLPFKLPDLSYGTYVYHLPIMLALIWHTHIKFTPVTALLATCAIVLPVSALSWFFLEKPALKWKDFTVKGTREEAPPEAVPQVA